MKTKTMAVAREIDWINRETGEVKKIRQNLVEVRAASTECASDIGEQVSKICSVVYPLGNSWLGEIVAEDSFWEVVDKFRSFVAREPEDDKNAPVVMVIRDEEYLEYTTASGSASLIIENWEVPAGDNDDPYKYETCYRVSATVWQQDGRVTPLLNAAKAKGLQAAVRREPVEVAVAMAAAK